MKNWLKTRKAYINWLSQTRLRREFSEKITFDELSLWWATNLMDKNNRSDTKWYENLNKKINNKNFSKINTNYIKLFIKLLLRFFFKILSIFLIKLILPNDFSKFKKKKTKDCFYSLLINIVDFKGKYIDRQYGLVSLKKKDEKGYIIEIPENIVLFKKIFSIKKKLKNVQLDYLILNSNLKIWDIFRVYFKISYLFFKVLKIINKHNYFIINKQDCKEILEEKLISSFFGPIQDQILKGIALKRCIDSIEPKNFINNFCFYPQARTLYFYSSKSNMKNNININHAIYSEQNIVWNFNKKDFLKNNFKYYSPHPDIFFCKGDKDYKQLKKIFKSKKIYRIGCLKTEIRPFTFMKRKSNILKKKREKQILTVLAGETDWKSIVKILNKCNLENFKIYLEPHPLNKKNTIEFFKQNLKSPFTEGETVDKSKLLRISNFILFGDTQLGVELAMKNFNVIRVYDSDYIPQYDINNEIPTACNEKRLTYLLNKKKLHRNVKQIEKNYFYKYDFKASNRLQKILDNL